MEHESACSAGRVPWARRLAWLVLVIAAASPASAQVCNRGTSYYFDQSHRCVGMGRQGGCDTARIYLLNEWQYQGKQFLLASTWTSVNIYEVTDPAQPMARLITPAWVPWGEVPPTSDWDEYQYDIALGTDHPYGISMFCHWGFVSTEVLTPTSPSGFSTRMRFELVMHDTAHRPTRACLFKSGEGRWHAVGEYLDQVGPNPPRIVDYADPANPVPVGPLTGAGSGQLECFEIGARWYVTVQAFQDSTGVVQIFDLTDPSAPTLLPLIPIGYRFVDYHVDAAEQRLFTVETGFAPGGQPGKLKIFDLSDPAQAALVAQTDLPITDDLTSFDCVAGAGNLVVVGQKNTALQKPPLRAYSLAWPNELREVAAGELDFEDKPEDMLMDLEVYRAANGDYVVYRAAFSVGSYTVLARECVEGAGPGEPEPAWEAEPDSEDGLDGDPAIDEDGGDPGAPEDDGGAEVEEEDTAEDGSDLEADGPGADGVDELGGGCGCGGAGFAGWSWVWLAVGLGWLRRAASGRSRPRR